ncbi:hypothetical protein TSUD_104940 [Trifolium subterraneum]|uniref:Integrase catalytic domain-containing protein n=1 Tax=Trifolium subterraneum TaxID=3900 RepID=A0A2Z6N4F0_TRISU|nr:hypothetical protein TSUD_104940 [Trifolium subterraneum]
MSLPNEVVFGDIIQANPRNTGVVYEVRVLRKWSVIDRLHPERVESVNMVFVDEHNHKIQATIPSDLISVFDHQLIEKNVYQVSSLSIDFNFDSLLPCHHRYKFIFNRNSKVIPSDNPLLPTYGLSLIGADSVHKKRLSQRYMVDVVGVVTAVQHDKNFFPDGKVTQSVTFQMNEQRFVGMFIWILVLKHSTMAASSSSVPMGTYGNGAFPGNLPILNGKNYDTWCKQMKVVFGFQDVWDLVQSGVEPITDASSDVEKATFKELKKKDYKALFIIHQCVSPDNFERVSDALSSKEAWDNLEKAYGGATKVKKVRLQTYKRQFELLQMEEKESVGDFVTRVTKLVNLMKGCVETMNDQYVVEKILRSLTPRFDKVVAIEESKDLSSTTVEEIQGVLEAYEHKLNERLEKGKNEVALQAHNNQAKRGKGKWSGNRGRGVYQGSNAKDNQESGNPNQKNGGRGGFNGNHRGGRGGRNGRGGFNGHKGFNKNDEARVAKQDESENPVMLMVTTKEDQRCGEEWYLDSGCSTHMTRRRDWFSSFDQSHRNKVKFANDSTLNAEGVGVVCIRSKNGDQAFINDVLYIPGIKCNLLSVGKLIEKDYKIVIEARMMKLMDSNRKFGHLNFRDLNMMSNKSMMSGLPKIQVPNEVCEDCVQSKKHMDSFNKDVKSRTKSVLEVIYSDVCGPMQVYSNGGNRYFVSFVDDHSRKLWTYLIKRKSEVFDVFKKFKAMAEKQSDHKLKVLKTDGGGEYVSNAFSKFCEVEGIVHEVIPPYTPQQNGSTERRNKTIMNMVRCMIREECWSYKPNVSHLKVFGSIAYRHVPDQLRSKLDDKSEVMVLVAYHLTGGYRLYDPISKSIVISRDVIVDEMKEWDWCSNKKKDSVSIMFDDVHTAPVETNESEVRRSTRTRTQPARLNDCIITSDNEINGEGDLVHLAFNVEAEPVNFEDAVKNEKWLSAMNEEIESIERNNTWELVDLPHGKKAIGVKWVYKVKLNPKGEITRHKARLVVKSFLQKEGIDFNEVFAPVARMETIRLVTAMAHYNGWSMHQMDVKCAFLNGPLDEEVYVTQPPGFISKEDEFKVYKLHKALYGLNQAPRAWNKRIDKFLSDIGFNKCVTEHGVYVKNCVKKGTIILCLYVDDLLITGSDEAHIREFKVDMMREFEMTDLGHISYFLGIEFQRTSEGLILHQKKYASEILKRFEMDQCNPALTPSEPRLQLSKESEEKDVDSTEYRRLIGSLRYLCNTRPAIAYSVGIVSRYMERPKTSHFSAAKRIFRYIKGTMDYRIVVRKPDKKSLDLIGYTDSNWCGDKDDRKSTAGYVFLYGGAPISWCSRKEPVVALSTCEAEYIAASLSACQGVWLSNLIDEISNVKCDSVILKVNNMSAINLAKNPIAHGRSKHIELRFHYLREQVGNGKLKLEHCRTDLQVADVLTKAVTVETFVRLRNLMCVKSLENMN